MLKIKDTTEYIKCISDKYTTKSNCYLNFFLRLCICHIGISRDIDAQSKSANWLTLIYGVVV